MSVTIGDFATVFTHLNDFLGLFDGAESPDDVQAILHRLAEDPENFNSLLIDLKQSTSRLASAELSMPVTNAEGPISPGEAYLQGQQASADLARTLGIDDLADEIEGLDPPTTYPFLDEEASRLLDYHDGFSRVSDFVKTKSASTGISGTDEEKKLSSFASRLLKLAVFHSKR